MQSYKYVIIGGGAAGVSAAETIRKNDSTGTIAIISDEPYLMYSRVMLSKPNFFLGKIPFDQIYLKKSDWYADSKIDFVGGKRATDLNAAVKTLSLSDGSKMQYEKLLIATGVDTRKWTVPGADKKGIHYLRNLDDSKGIMEALKNTKKAVTIGGGFISFEMTDLLRMANIDTTLVLRESYFWEPTLDRASGQMIEDAILKGGAKIIKNAEVSEVYGKGDVEGVILCKSPNFVTTEAPSDPTGTNLPCEMIMCGIGVVNPIEWLKKENSNDAPAIATNRGILANEYLETNIPDVWTAGDIAEYNDLLLEEHVQMGNWVNAHEQGRIAGNNMAAADASSGSGAKKEPFKFVSFYTTQGFGISIAFVGDVTPGSDRTIIARGSPEINSYARIILVNGEVEGATMINRTSEMTTISKLIEKNIKVGDKIKELGDVNFDLKELVK